MSGGNDATVARNSATLFFRLRQFVYQKCNPLRPGLWFSGRAGEVDERGGSVPGTLEHRGGSKSESSKGGSWHAPQNQHSVDTERRRYTARVMSSQVRCAHLPHPSHWRAATLSYTTFSQRLQVGRRDDIRLGPGLIATSPASKRHNVTGRRPGGHVHMWRRFEERCFSEAVGAKPVRRARDRLVVASALVGVHPSCGTALSATSGPRRDRKTKSDANSRRSRSLGRPSGAIVTRRCGGAAALLTRTMTGSRGSLSIPGGM